MKITLRCLWILAITPLAAAASAQAVEPLAQQARAVLERHCHVCHGREGSSEGGFSYVLDHQRLIDLDKVVPGNLGKSTLFERVLGDEMPPPEDNEGNLLTPLSDADKDVLRKWIEAGAANFNEPAAERVRITPAAMLDLMAADLRQISKPERKFMRYLTLSHLYNAGLAEEELQTYRIALAKLINSLSRQPTVVRPRPIDPAQTILRIDTRHYGWAVADDKWQRIAAANPYGIRYGTPSEQFCVAETGTDMPYLRGDWFVASASRPPLYHDVLDIPQTAGELEAELEVDAAANLRDGLVARAGFGISGVSNSNRIIERHKRPFGAYWKSYDFASSAGRQDIFTNPLGPAAEGEAWGFLHAGGELIFNLPNGLQAYMLVDAAGLRIDEGPTTIVHDDKRPSRVVVNGLSCISCHEGGMNYKADEIRSHVEASPTAFTDQELRTIRDLYPRAEEFNALLDRDAALFTRAVAECGVPLNDRGQIDSADPIMILVRLFEKELTLTLAAAEAGVTEDEFREGLERSVELSRAFGSLKQRGYSVKRDKYLGDFALIVTKLELGELIGAPQPTQPEVTPTAPDLSPELFAGRWRNDSTSWLYTVRFAAGEPQLASVLDSDGDPFVLQGSVWDAASRKLTWRYKSATTGSIFEEHVQLEDENALSGDYTVIAADGARSPGTDRWARAAAAVTAPQQLAGRWRCESSSAAYTFAVADGTVSLESIVDDDGESFDVLESRWDPQTGLVRWTYRVPSTGYTVAEVAGLSGDDALTGTWTSTPPGGGEANEGSDSWTRIARSEADFAGRWLNASTQAVYTIELIAGQPKLVSAVDDDGEVFPIERSTFDGAAMRWVLTVPSTGARVAEEAQLTGDGDELAGPWEGIAADGTHRNGQNAWSRLPAEQADNGASFAGRWLCASNRAVYTIDFDGTRPRLTAIRTADGGSYPVESTSFAAGAMTWRYRVPDSGYVVEERMRQENETALAGTWAATAPDGTSNDGTETFSRMPEQLGLEGRWRDNDTQAIYTIASVAGEPQLTAVVAADGEEYEVQESVHDGEVLRWTYRVGTSGYVVREAVRLRGADGLIGNWTNRTPAGEKSAGSSTFSRESP